MPFNRRVFLGGTSAILATTLHGAPVASGQPRSNQTAKPAAKGLPANWKKLRKIDVHMHVAPTAGLDYGDADTVIEAADALGIQQLWVSRPVTRSAGGPPEEVRKANDLILAAMKRHPGRLLGYCFLIPGRKETLPELERCLDAGMMGVKLYNQYKFSDPVCYPIIERCIEAGIPILEHAGHPCDAPTIKRQPNISDASEFCKVGKRYPEAIVIHAHVHGGGDWEWTIKRLRACPSIYLDTSGSVLDDRGIDMAVETLGHKRILFATDTSMETGVGKILAARLTEEQRDAIFWKNAVEIQKRRKT